MRRATMLEDSSHEVGEVTETDSAGAAAAAAGRHATSKLQSTALLISQRAQVAKPPSRRHRLRKAEARTADLALNHIGPRSRGNSNTRKDRLLERGARRGERKCGHTATALCCSCDKRAHGPEDVASRSRIP